MQIKRQKLPGSQEQLTIEVEPKEVEVFLAKAAENISSQQKIPGFRQGKTPFDVLKEKIGFSPIWQEAARIFIKEKYVQILDQANIEPIDSPRVEILNVIPRHPLVFRLTLTRMPRVLSINYSDIEVEKPKTIVVEEGKIEKVLKDLQFQKRREVLVKRPARLGDRVEADLYLSFQGVPLENGQAKNAVFFLGKNYYVPGFSENLVGLKTGETKKFSLKYPENHYDKKLAGKVIDFSVKINNIYQIDLPPIDDSFAQSLGVKDAETLRNKIKSNLEKEGSIKQEQQAELNILKELLKRAEIEDIPDILIERETDKMLSELKRFVERQGFLTPDGERTTNFDDYLRAIKKTEDEIKNGFKPQAEERVKTTLIIQEIAKQEKIEVSQKEIEEEINKASLIYKERPDIIEELKTEKGQYYLKNTLIFKKVLALFKRA